MAEKDAFMSTNPQSHITRHQFNALLASHRAFHEVAIKVTDILQDPSRSAHYQPHPSTSEGDIDVSLLDNKRNSTRDDSLFSRQQSSGLKDDSSRRLLQRHERGPAPDEALSNITFASENMRARKAYSQKQQRSIRMYARASGSSPNAEYDFQCKTSSWWCTSEFIHSNICTKDKFFSNHLYQQPEALGFDPWQWASKTPDHSDVDAYNAYHQIDHGLRLQKMVLTRKSELMEALFPLRTSGILQCMSWRELEYSYGLHLGDIIDRLGFSKCDNAIGYMDSDITLVIIEIGRFFTELDYSNRPKDFHLGNIPDAAGPFVNEPWSKNVRKQFTLKQLHRRCHQKGLMKDWEGKSIRRIVFDSKYGTNTGTGTTERQAELLYILETIFAINRARRRNWPLRRLITEKESQMFILDFLGLFDAPPSQDDLERSNDQVFVARDLNFQILRTLGGLRVIWSDCIDDHLRLSTSARTLTLFWDVSLLDQSLLFWYNAHYSKDLANNISFHYPEARRDSKFGVLYELKNTYRLLFHNIDAKQFTTTETCAVKDANRRLGIMVHDLRVDINSSRARKILKYFLGTPVPNKIARGKSENARLSPNRNIWWRIDRALAILRRLTRRDLQPSNISDHLASGPPYSLDLCWHLENMLNPYPALIGESESIRSFSDFPRFGSRLREIKFYMDNQKPSGWYEMWKDKRDRVQYVTFWAVLVFGTISIVLALVSIAVSSAQTVAAFRSVQGSNQ